MSKQIPAARIVGARRAEIGPEITNPLNHNRRNSDDDVEMAGILPPRDAPPLPPPPDGSLPPAPEGRRQNRGSAQQQPALDLMPKFLSSDGIKPNPIPIDDYENGQQGLVGDVYAVMNAGDDRYQQPRKQSQPTSSPTSPASTIAPRLVAKKILSPIRGRGGATSPTPPDSASWNHHRRDSEDVYECELPRRRSMKAIRGDNLARFQQELEREELDLMPLPSEFPDPQKVVRIRSSYVIWLICIVNVFASLYYLHWRWLDTYPDKLDSKLDFRQANFKFWWWWGFFVIEAWLMLGVFIGHTMRLFPCRRLKITMDQLSFADPNVGYNSRVAILVPTAGEKLSVVLSAMIGACSQRLWASGLTPAQTCRVIILDEKRRQDVFQLVCWLYEISRIIHRPAVRDILLAEGLNRITIKAFYDWCKDKGGYKRRHLYDNRHLNRAVLIVRKMELLIGLVEMSTLSGKDAVIDIQNPEEFGLDPTQSIRGHGKYGVKDVLRKEAAEAPIQPGFFKVFSEEHMTPILTYYSRVNAGTPKVSPKAGNMNSALFPLDYPSQEPFIGPCTIVVVNDARHQLEPNFLQRTVPYFFQLDVTQQVYKWAKIAFVQTPQRFRESPSSALADDPLGNEAVVQYDIINMGKDGVGAVSSSGQGSLWRVEALKGATPYGKLSADRTNMKLVGKKLGFRSQLLIEDTHTSIDLFRLGWRSAYVNEAGEVLAWCTHQPDNITWRMKQVLRWHQGAAQMLLFKSLIYNLLFGNFPTIWHRIYVIDQTTYFLQAIPGYFLLLFPVIYGISGMPPFSTDIGSYFSRFVPVVLTAMLPTTIASGWRNVDSDKLTRDEQVWLSTCYIQVYAFVQTLWSFIMCRGRSNAWTASAPIFPLFFVFFAQFVAIGAGAIHLFDENDFAPHFLAIVASAFVALHSLWPMIALQMGWHMPSMYYTKMGVWFIVGVLAILITNVPSSKWS